MASIPQDAVSAQSYESAAPAVARVRRVVYRHTLPLRLMHWINAVCLLVLLGSGLQVFNAHPALYWGQASTFHRPWLSIGTTQVPGGPLHGVTMLGSHRFNTTGVLGVSDMHGQATARGFPAWATIPGPQWLSMGRAWHFFFAWLFAVNGVCFVAYAAWTRHLTRDLVPTLRDWRGIGRSILDHALLRHPKGEAALRYNVLQRLAYLGVIFVLGGGVVLMGLAMSPRMDSVLGWLVDAVGGRQSARSIHFLCAVGFVVFFLVHIFEVIVTGLGNNLRSIITGRYAIETTESPPRATDDCASADRNPRSAHVGRTPSAATPELAGSARPTPSAAGCPEISELEVHDETDQ